MLKAFRKSKIGRSMMLACSVGAASLMALPSVKATTIDLGAASGYAVFALDQFSYNGPGSIVGNVAVGGSTNFASPATITGTVFLNTGVAHQGNIVPTGGFVTTDLSQAISDAKTEASTLFAATPTQTLGTLGNNSVVTGTSGTNVVDVSGINMSNGTLTLSGTPSSIFIINDTGGFTSSNSDMVLSGGVTPANILFNIAGNVAITGGGGNNFYGTILAPVSQVAVHDKQLAGEIIGLDIADTSGFQVTNVTPVPVPAPIWTSGILAGLIGLVKFRKLIPGLS